MNYLGTECREVGRVGVVPDLPICRRPLGHRGCHRGDGWIWGRKLSWLVHKLRKDQSAQRIRMARDSDRNQTKETPQ